MKDKAMSLLNGLCSWLSSLGIAASIVVALFLGCSAAKERAMRFTSSG